MSGKLDGPLGFFALGLLSLRGLVPPRPWAAKLRLAHRAKGRETATARTRPAAKLRARSRRRAQLSVVVVTTCTNRKTQPAAESLRGRSLSRGSSEAVATDWRRRLQEVTPGVPARRLYAGRAFREAEAAACEAEARLTVVSAGLGWIDGDTGVPAYDLTLSRNSADNVLSKTAESPACWWTALQGLSPTAKAVWDEGGLILAALSATYLAMVANTWAEWPADRLSRLRLFTKDLPPQAPEPLRKAWMPYDDRLDQVGAGSAGTQGDFAQRALRQFVRTRLTGQGSSAAEDARAVQAELHGLRPRVRPERTRLSDAEIIAVLQREWSAVGGRSGLMLRRLRDDLGIACEQARFKDLFARATSTQSERPL